MTNAEYQTWTQHHRELFLMNAPDHDTLFARWWPSLLPFPLPDCEAASRWLAESGHGRFRQDHLALLLDRLRHLEAARHRKHLDEQEQLDPVRCLLCSGSGIVAVPHPRFVVDGFWKRHGRSYATLGVSCRCHAGNRLAIGYASYSIESGRRGLTLDEYEQRVPHWPELICERDNARKDEDAAQRTAEHLDRKLGPLAVAEKLAWQFGVGKKNG